MEIVKESPEMSDEEYQQWLEDFKAKTNARQSKGAQPIEIPDRVYRYWERNNQSSNSDEANVDINHPD